MDYEQLRSGCQQCAPTDCRITFGGRPKEKHRRVQKAVSIVLFKKKARTKHVHSLHAEHADVPLSEQRRTQNNLAVGKKHTQKLH